MFATRAEEGMTWFAKQAEGSFGLFRSLETFLDLLCPVEV